MAFDLYIFGPFGDGRTVAQASACGVALLPGSSLSRWVSQLSVLHRVFGQADSSARGRHWMSYWCASASAGRNRLGPRRSEPRRPTSPRGQIAVCVAQVAILIAALILRIGNI